MSIGGRDEREAYQLGRTIGALQLSDGQIVVADGLPRELRYYDPQGGHLRTIGGSGSGPGEFNRLSSIARIHGDTIVVWDVMQRRLSLFSPDGRLSSTSTIPAFSTVRLELQKRLPRHFLAAADVHRLNGGRILIQPNPEPNVEEITQTQVVQDSIPLVLVDQSGEDWIETGTFAGTEYFFQEKVGAVHPLGERLRVAAAGDVVYAASTRDTAIQVISPTTGEVVRVIALPVARRAPSRDDIEFHGRRMLDGVQSSVQPRMARYVDAVPWPESLPLFSDIRVSADQRLWVQLYRAPTDVLQEWLVFEPSGDLAASFTMDPSLVLLDVGRDFALVRAADERDVEEIRKHSLIGTAGER